MNCNKPFYERREFVRFSFFLRLNSYNSCVIKIEDDNELYYCSFINISLGGMQLKCEGEIQNRYIGRNIEVVGVFNQRLQKLIGIKGKIVWIKDKYFGVKFSKVLSISILEELIGVVVR